MELEFARGHLIMFMRARQLSPEDAARELAAGFNMPAKTFDEAVRSVRREGRRNALLDSPPGVVSRDVRDEAGRGGWYAGASEGDVYWPRLRSRLMDSSMSGAVQSIDEASTKVVANLADPTLPKLTKRGLVLGYVQSGKTANFTAVMAKAADAGYSLFIVLSGLHNNLREQTQVRLDGDLLDDNWHQLTTRESDFVYNSPGAALAKRRVPSLAVVKKNQARLRALRDWLRGIPKDIRRRLPILILDDEADQATPNSANGRDNHSRINELVRQIWAEVVTGTYVGYTATPFANIFMDPNDELELYPADFIIDLPRPESYFGSERIFGREPLEEDDEPDPGLDMIREVSEDDASLLKARGNKSERASFDPPLPPSLVQAITWFIVATAIRRARGQHDKHSSMLIHTTHFVDPHFAMSRRVKKLLRQMRDDWDKGDHVRFIDSFEEEAGRVQGVSEEPLPSWTEVEQRIRATLEEVRVVVDNGSSEDRLDYDRRDKDGDIIPETVIAIGGGTLSRGLTLEGLVVSYFTRTSNTYDTLLQMGRWFGFRTGYEDLPRMWLQNSLEQEFRFLALVEEEIRRDIRDMEKQQLEPRQVGVRVRAHPGRLEIVARNKMQYADKIAVTYSGQRMQTFMLEEHDEGIIRRNIGAARAFIHRCRESRSLEGTRHPARWLLRDVPANEVTRFIREYSFHPEHMALKPESLIGWIEQAVPDRLWNIVVAGSNAKQTRPDGSPLDLGTIDLGGGLVVPTVNRAPLKKDVVPGTANIKSLLSKADWFADLNLDELGVPAEDRTHPQDVRRKHANDRGLLIIMPVSKDSIPLRSAALGNSRRDMEAPDHLMGLGLIFPETPSGSRESGEYFAVRPDWEPEITEDDDIPEDVVEEDSVS